MIETNMFDRIIRCDAWNPHDHDFWYRRKDGTVYVEEIRKDKENHYYEPEIQLEIQYDRSQNGQH